MTKITRSRVDYVFTTDTGRTVTVTAAFDFLPPPWETAEPHVETFIYAAPNWTDPTPLDEIESPLAAAYVNHRLAVGPTVAARAAVRFTPGATSQHVAVFEDPEGWEILFATRPGHEFTYEEFKTFLADVGHYLRGEVWWINNEVVYAFTASDAAIRYLDTHP